MPQCIRPNPKLFKLAYKLLQTDKDLQQKNTYTPSERQLRDWASTYTKSNIR